VPAEPSSSIPSGLTVLGQAEPLRPAETPHLLAYLATITDPRARAGRRHPLVAILALAAAAVLAGARSLAAIAEWAADAPQPVRAALGTRRDPLTGRWAVPTETTIRRTLARLDAEALAAAIGGWLADRERSSQRRRAVAVDGKTLRGACRDGRPAHLLAAMEHATRAVLAQRQVDGAPGEVPAFQPLLDGLDLAGVVVTADALHTHAAAAEFLVACKQAHYLFTVKANQPTLLARCARLAWHNVPVLDRTRDRGHGRVELRSLTFAQASPARLADYLRGHWAIENGLHHVRDVTFAEDASQLRTGSGPHTMACLRNLVIGVLGRAGPVNLAVALRHHARDPARPLATLGITLV
jgi:predicted transposase YbfD/YdcC